MGGVGIMGGMGSMGNIGIMGEVKIRAGWLKLGFEVNLRLLQRSRVMR